MKNELIEECNKILNHFINDGYSISDNYKDKFPIYNIDDFIYLIDYNRVYKVIQTNKLVFLNFFEIFNCNDVSEKLFLQINNYSNLNTEFGVFHIPFKMMVNNKKLTINFQFCSSKFKLLYGKYFI